MQQRSPTRTDRAKTGAALAAPTRLRLRPRLRLPAALVLGAALVSGCALLPPDTPVEPPRAAPERPAEVLPDDPLSDDLRAYYADIENERRAARLMRTDDGAEDVVMTPARLAEIYIQVALHEEQSGGFNRAGRPSVLRRWVAPVRYRMEFGASSGRQARVDDFRTVRELAARLSTASGHAISVEPLGQSDGNFHVLVLSETERRDAAARIRELVPGISDGAVRLITDMPRETFCLVMAFSRDGSAEYSEALAIVRSEHPDLTRTACYHEELTQGLGLASDSSRARPSIFNDDQEFALITPVDLLLLRIHYDPRLQPGMTEREARPIIFTIASELIAGAS
ncbi:DUF2927 domain-containing protein [Pararhodobacter marinus]|uniref:DUF2927 domain-containing protein n=1 Tax=Pararhodobacter marinus TaxID=2184063 RepID=UPI0011B1E102|nr:DUF2927 domain-containing protein [Pararhodobacter marinus]